MSFSSFHGWGQKLRLVGFFLACLGVSYFALKFMRSPFATWPFAYYDDAETLYHAKAWLNGGVPYLSDYNHHFAGYVLPYAFAGKFFGFSPDLLTYVFLASQLVVASCVFLILAIWFPPALCALGALLTVLAREPWVLGYFVQYQINVFSSLILLFCCLAVASRRVFPILIGGLLCGLAFIFDQRCLFLLAFPLISVLIIKGPRIGPLLGSGLATLFSFALLPSLALGYLYTNGALQKFLEQTLVFPLIYRSGSRSLGQKIFDGLYLQRYLFTDTPILLCFALIGFVILVRSSGLDSASARARMILCLSGPIFFLMPLFGGRDFNYYTLTWLPYLGLLAIFSLELFSQRWTKIFAGILLCAPIVFSIWSASNLRTELGKRTADDGIAEVAQAISSQGTPRDSVFVWGYRLDLYLKLNRLSPYPFSNMILAHPDQGVSFYPQRKRHIYPKYEKEFLDLLATNPPKWLVFFSRPDTAPLPSRSYDAVRALAEKEYQLSLQIERVDFRGAPCAWEVFSLK